MLNVLTDAPALPFANRIFHLDVAPEDSEVSSERATREHL